MKNHSTRDVVGKMAGPCARMCEWARSDRGATAVEYGLMVAGVAMLIVIAVFAAGGNLGILFRNIATETAKWLGP